MAGKPIARMLDQFTCPQHPPTFFLTPALVPVTRLVDGLMVIRLGDYGICSAGLDVVAEGSNSKLICGLPIARKGDAMMHGGTITTGSPTEEDGSGTFSLPKNLKIDGSSSFQNKVVRDLFFLSTTKSGKEWLDRTAQHGQPVVVSDFTNPGNNRTVPADLDKVRRGESCGSTIYYDPDTADLRVPGTTPGQTVPCPPQVNLGHELNHTVRFGEGRGYAGHAMDENETWGGPHSPIQARDKKLYDGERAKRRAKDGRGPAKPSPTENDLRKELNLGQRGAYSPHSTGAPMDLRPGVCK